MTDIRRVGVAGAGTMGAGIAIVSARGGFETVLYDIDAGALESALSHSRSFFAKSVEKGKLTQDHVNAILGRLGTTTELKDLGGSDIVIEAVYEDSAVKRELFGRVDAICPPETIFASNTSTLSITEIAAGSGRDDRCVGMHFCLPAPLMKLVEMSAGLETDEAVFARAWSFCEAMGQRPVRTKDSPGFILNYLLVPWHNDVIRLVEAGVAEPADIDLAVKKALGYPLGPCELLDMVGMDTQVLLCEAFYGVTNDPRAACPPLVRKMVAAGRLGRKSKRGFFNYEGPAMFGA